MSPLKRLPQVAVLLSGLALNKALQLIESQPDTIAVGGALAATGSTAAGLQTQVARLLNGLALLGQFKLFNGLRYAGNKKPRWQH